MRTKAEWMTIIGEQGHGIGSRPRATLANLRMVDEALTGHPASVRLWNRRGDLIQLLEEVDTPYSLSDALASYERARVATERQVVSQSRRRTRMKTLFRLALVLVSGVSALYFVFWVGGAILMALHLPLWLSLAVSLVAAVAVARYVWLHTASLKAGLAGSIVLGAVILGCFGFAGGFFGPIIFMPGANQGPLLGIFITGPLGFVFGAVGGAIYWFVRGRHQVPTLPESTAG